jgi:hypothetical protein
VCAGERTAYRSPLLKRAGRAVGSALPRLSPPYAFDFEEKSGSFFCHPRESGDPYAVPYRSTAEYGSRASLSLARDDKK